MKGCIRVKHLVDLPGVARGGINEALGSRCYGSIYRKRGDQRLIDVERKKEVLMEGLGRH